MIAKSVVVKIKDILKFLLSTFTMLFTSIIVSTIAFIAIALIGGNMAGDWTIGTTFEEWWSDMGGKMEPDGKFSAVNPKTCWCCLIFSRLFDLMGTMGVNLYVYIADIAWVLIWSGLAVWILNYMYKNIILEQSGDISKMIKEISKKVIVIGIISAAFFYTTNKEENHEYIKSMANTIFENTAVPVLKMGVGLSSSILQNDICSKLSYPEPTEANNILSKELKNDMLCLMNNVNTVFFSAMTAGTNMVSMSWKSFVSDMANNAKNLPDIVAGMAIIVIFFMMYVTIPFTLIDIVFTTGILIAFIPLFLVSYAYSDVGKVKGFADNGIKSLWHMAFYIIMYSIFLGITYSSFVYIADMYYPGPLDNFTYLFPDFIYADMVNSNSDTIRLSEAFKACVDAATVNDKVPNVSKIQDCLLRSNINMVVPSLENPGGSFLPMFTFGLLSIMIMFGSLESYAGLVSGDMFVIGAYAQSMIKSGISMVTKVIRTGTNFIKDKVSENMTKDFDDEVAELKKAAKEEDEEDNS